MLSLMRSRFVRFWASVLTILGCLAIVAGVAIGIAPGVAVTLLPGAATLASQPALAGVPVGVLGALAGFVAGALVGAPLVAMGQGLRLLLQQHARLVRIERRLRARAVAPATVSPVPSDASSSEPPASGTHSLADRLRVRR
jgi:ABC-type transport system involved in cytochrome c biogenesis permease subunit